MEIKAFRGREEYGRDYQWKREYRARHMRYQDEKIECPNSAFRHEGRAAMHRMIGDVTDQEHRRHRNGRNHKSDM